MTEPSIEVGQIWSHRTTARQIVVAPVDQFEVRWASRIYDPALVINSGTMFADTLHRDYILDGSE